MILFKDIYEKAINLFDDPDIQRAYVFDKIKFQKIMYSYFQNGIFLFDKPMGIVSCLSETEDPIGNMEIFDGDGTNTYHMSTTPKDNSEFSFRIDGNVDDSAFFDKDSNSVVFSKNVDSGKECSVEWYFGGAFTTDFSDAAIPSSNSKEVFRTVSDILARTLILAWAEKEKNFVLDIRNLLTDTDFKIYSPANSVRAKVDWVKDLKFQLDNLQNRLGWLMFDKFRSGGQRYGP